MAGSVNKVQPDIASLYASGLSLPDIERQTGIPRSTVRSRLVAAGVILRARADAIRACPRLGDHLRGKKRGPMSAEQRRAVGAGRLAWADENAAGVSLKPNGYVEITRGDNKGRSQHVILMEEQIGRRLRANEVVHHIDGNRSNNDLNNLALMTRAEHTRLHRREEALAKGNINGVS